MITWIHGEFQSGYGKAQEDTTSLGELVKITEGILLLIAWLCQGGL